MPNDFNAYSRDVQNYAWENLFWSDPQGGPLQGVDSVRQVDYADAIEHLNLVASPRGAGAASYLEPPSDAVGDYQAVYARLALMDPASLTPEMHQFIAAFDQVFHQIDPAEVDSHPSLQALGLLIQARQSGDPGALAEFEAIYQQLSSQPESDMTQVMRLFLQAMLENKRLMQQTSAQRSAGAAQAEFHDRMDAAAKDAEAGHKQMVGGVTQGTMAAAAGSLQLYGGNKARLEGNQAATHLDDQARANLAASRTPDAAEVPAAQAFAAFAGAGAQRGIQNAQSYNALAASSGAVTNSVGTVTSATEEGAAAQDRAESQKKQAVAALQSDRHKAAEELSASLLQGARDLTATSQAVMSTLNEAEDSVARNV